MFDKADHDSYFEKIFWDKRFFVQGIVKKYIRNNDLVDDIVQKTFLKLYLNIKKVRKAEYLNAYIHKVTVNTVLDCLRKRSSEFEISVDRLEEIFPDGKKDTEKELNNRMALEPFQRSSYGSAPKKERGCFS